MVGGASIVFMARPVPVLNNIVSELKKSPMLILGDPGVQLLCELGHRFVDPPMYLLYNVHHHTSFDYCFGDQVYYSL
jgi:diaminopimelate decarboxylase